MAQLIHRNSFATNSTDIFNTHRDEPHNNPSTPFEISAVSEGGSDQLGRLFPTGNHQPMRAPHALMQANMVRINAIIARYPPNYKASAVIPVLDLVQQMNGGWLSLTAMNKVAAVLEMQEIRVYEVRRRHNLTVDCGAVSPLWAVPISFT